MNGMEGKLEDRVKRRGGKVKLCGKLLVREGQVNEYTAYSDRFTCFTFCYVAAFCDNHLNSVYTQYPRNTEISQSHKYPDPLL